MTLKLSIPTALKVFLGMAGIILACLILASTSPVDSVQYHRSVNVSLLLLIMSALVIFVALLTEEIDAFRAARKAGKRGRKTSQFIGTATLQRDRHRDYANHGMQASHQQARRKNHG